MGVCAPHPGLGAEPGPPPAPGTPPWRALMVGRGGVSGVLLTFGWRRVAIVSKLSVLTGCLFSGSFPREWGLPRGGSLVSLYIGIARFPASSAPALRSMRQKEEPGPRPRARPRSETPGRSALFSAPFGVPPVRSLRNVRRDQWHQERGGEPTPPLWSQKPVHSCS